jgi:signal peptidase I
VIGVPGDEVQLKNGSVVINGQPIYDPWGQHDSQVGLSDAKKAVLLDNFGPAKLSPTEYFILGDNRDYSYDSRFRGSVPRQNIVGKVLLRYLPRSRIGWVF